MWGYLLARVIQAVNSALLNDGNSYLWYRHDWDRFLSRGFFGWVS